MSEKVIEQLQKFKVIFGDCRCYLIGGIPDSINSGKVFVEPQSCLENLKKELGVKATTLLPEISGVNNTLSGRSSMFGDILNMKIISEIGTKEFELFKNSREKDLYFLKSKKKHQNSGLTYTDEVIVNSFVEILPSIIERMECLVRNGIVEDMYKAIEIAIIFEKLSLLANEYIDIDKMIEFYNIAIELMNKENFYNLENTLSHLLYNIDINALKNEYYKNLKIDPKEKILKLKKIDNYTENKIIQSFMFNIEECLDDTEFKNSLEVYELIIDPYVNICKSGIFTNLNKNNPLKEISENPTKEIDSEELKKFLQSDFSKQDIEFLLEVFSRQNMQICFSPNVINAIIEILELMQTEKEEKIIEKNQKKIKKQDKAEKKQRKKMKQQRESRQIIMTHDGNLESFNEVIESFNKAIKDDLKSQFDSELLSLSDTYGDRGKSNYGKLVNRNPGWNIILIYDNTAGAIISEDDDPFKELIIEIDNNNSNISELLKKYIPSILKLLKELDKGTLNQIKEIFSDKDIQNAFNQKSGINIMDTVINPIFAEFDRQNSVNKAIDSFSDNKQHTRTFDD